ncbi:methyltransferase [Myriangium duriaei CBS 260.36]|uniref:Methyltransferase n=1 Tax=Myriangium duriaei CBS 260.36 TaxID=1168546 RepID=A0A9P4MF09_9PEZI|nr:methyltransferase [Myriangium duriaei CBS 260.36]
MTCGQFKYIDPATLTKDKPWAKVDNAASSFTLRDYPYEVSNMRGHESSFHTDTSGFAVYHSPAKEKTFTSDPTVRDEYYGEIESVLRSKLPGISKVVIFDHTIRRRVKDSPRQPVQQVHVDQTPGAAEVRVRRHLPAEEVDALLKKRYQIINVWRPIENVATDFPLAVVDWRSTTPEDFVPVNLMYPVRQAGDDGDDRGKEVLATGDPQALDGYEVKGETFAVKPSEAHRFWYMKDMTPDEVMFIKCFDSRSKTMTGSGEVAHCTPHTAFVDPETPAEAKGRQSIEVRCLVFYDD